MLKTDLLNHVAHGNRQMFATMLNIFDFALNFSSLIQYMLFMAINLT